jgi:hypothetical protein
MAWKAIVRFRKSKKAMNSIEWYIIGIAAVGLTILVRGCFRASNGDCALGLLIGSVACIVYFFVFRLTRTEYLGAMILGCYVPALVLVPKMRRSHSGYVLIGASIVLTAAAAITEYKLVSTGNSLLVIEPYRAGNQWRFDEPLLHLKGEPFVEGIPEMIDKMVVGIPGSDKRVRLIFSQQPFPGAQIRLDWRREQYAGNWYYNEDYKMEGWLCPALFQFFPRAPHHIYVRAEAV